MGTQCCARLLVERQFHLFLRCCEVCKDAGGTLAKFSGLGTVAPQLEPNDFMLGVHGLGWQVDRAVLDRVIAHAAAGGGCEMQELGELLCDEWWDKAKGISRCNASSDLGSRAVLGPTKMENVPRSDGEIVELVGAKLGGTMELSR
ncbi:MAG: hypothetical protein WAU58_03030 [Terriglobales bacterium]